MPSQSIRPPAVLFGGLNVLRCLGQAGIPTHVACTDPEAEVLHSRYCTESFQVADPAKHAERCAEQFAEHARGLSDKPPLFFGDDPKLTFVLRQREILSQYYRFLLPDSELIEDMLDKNRFTALAERLKLPVPATVFSEEVDNPEGLLQRIPLPVIIKPRRKKDWKESGLGPQLKKRPEKGILVESREDLSVWWERLITIPSGFLVQEYVPGGDDAIVSFHSFVDDDSELRAWFVGKKLRTFPRVSGESTFLELIHDDGVTEAGQDILRRLDFRGVSKIDFKRHAESGKLYLLEINPRFNLWHYLGSRAGVNLPLQVYDYLLGNRTRFSATYSTNYRWMNAENDIRALLDYRRFREATVCGWLSSLAHPKVYKYFSWRDPGPFLHKFKRLIGKSLGLVVRRPSGVI